jgi:GxxExxY protein
VHEKQVEMGLFIIYDNLYCLCCYIRMIGRRDPITYAILGAAFEVHRELGSGFLEAVYHEALAREFSMQNMQFECEVPLPICYKGERWRTVYRADFVCFDCVVLEIKAKAELGEFEKAQIIHYLKATGLKKGLLLNFGCKSLQYRRFVF